MESSKPQHPRHSQPPQRHCRMVVDSTSIGTPREGGHDHGRVSHMGDTASTVLRTNAGSQLHPVAPFSPGGKPKQGSFGGTGLAQQSPSHSPQLSSFTPGAAGPPDLMFGNGDFSDLNVTNSHTDFPQLSRNVDQAQVSAVQSVTQSWAEQQVGNDDRGKDLSSAGFLEFEPNLEMRGGNVPNVHSQGPQSLEVKGGNGLNVHSQVPQPREVEGANVPNVHSRFLQKRHDDNNPWLPPGFRFHPTDEELVAYYLTNKVANGTVLVQAIAEVDLNKCEPWDLPAKAKMGEKEWYFFSLRDRKYPTGMRTNRATEAGYWKATGKDREVMSSRTGRLVGMKKTLVFYRGRAPKGEKTNWIMHEYRIEGEPTPLIHASKLSKDEWVVCRIFQKSAGGKKIHLECNSNVHHRTTSFNTETLLSLPVLMEYPNPNNSVDDSDCIMDGGVQDGMKSSNSWAGMNLGTALEDLHHGKGSLRCPSYLIDLYAAAAPDMGAVTSSGLKVDNGGYPGKLLRQDSSNFNLQNSHLMSLKYLDHQSSSRRMNRSHLRACKAEPYAGDEDEAHSSASQRSSLMDSWVGGDSSGRFSSEASLPAMTNESSVTDLDNDTFFRYNRNLGSATFIPDPSHPANPAAGVELAESGLWGY